jgi:hypothetical protein
MLVDVGKLQDAISGDGEYVHEGKFTRGEDELESKHLLNNRMQDVDNEIEGSL